MSELSARYARVPIKDRLTDKKHRASQQMDGPRNKSRNGKSLWLESSPCVVKDAVAIEGMCSWVGS